MLLRIKPLYLYIAIAFIFYTILTFFSVSIPFFWDGEFSSKTAHYIYGNSFSNFIIPADYDTGYFPFFGIYMAAWWTVFGRSLFVCHLAMLPFLLGIAWEYFIFANRFLSSKHLPLLLILLILQPVLLTQSIIMGYDLMMVYFFFLALNFLWTDKKLFYSLSLALLCLSNMRGIILLPALFLFQCFMIRHHHKKLQIQSFLPFLLPVVLCSLWIVYHHAQTGWYVVSPLMRSSRRYFINVEMIARQFIYILWKFSDFGMIFPVLFFIATSIIFFIKKKVNLEIKQLVFLTTLIMFFLILFMAPLSNPIGHRYFIIPSLLLLLSCVYLLNLFKREFIKYFIIGFFAVTMITGNFWIYPERFGNGWDCSLKVLPFFKMEKNVHEYMKGLNAQTDNIGASFPLFSDLKYTYLEENNSHFTDVDDKPMKEFDYILYSNICNNLPLSKKKLLEETWVPQKTFRSGMVYIIVYKNPAI
jgi:hypothetical protein